MRIRAALLVGTLALFGGCVAMSGSGEVGPPDPGSPLADCRADSYAFAGRGTLAGLGLVGQSAAELPEPNRPATIWVTRDPVLFDAAGPGGSRMLCFEFDDGSGGSEWPINAAWLPPITVASAEIDVPVPLLLVVLVTMLLVGGLAFRRR